MLLIILLLWSKVFLKPALAASSQPLIGVTPAIIDEVIQKDKSKEITVYVYNLSNQALPIKSKVKPFIPEDDYEESDIFDIVPWIKVIPQEFILKPQERKAVKIFIKADKNAEPGSHYSTVLFSPMVLENNDKTPQVGVSAQVGVLNFITVKGDLVESGQIQYFTVSNLNFNLPVKFDFKIINSGNVHFVPSGNLIVKNIRNKTIDNIPIPNNLVLPHTAKNLSIKTDRKFLFGIYSVQLEIYYGTEHKLITSEPKKIIILPGIILIPLIFLTCIVIYLTINYRKFKLVIKTLLNRS